jgi:hypothetical protein
MVFLMCGHFDLKKSHFDSRNWLPHVLQIEKVNSSLLVHKKRANHPWEVRNTFFHLDAPDCTTEKSGAHDLENL